jgi:SAM-dependent methyltransferase
MAGTRLSKLCEIEDFTDPDVRRVIRTVFAHECERFGPDFPDGVEYRKHWEVALAVRTFEVAGLLDGTTTVLGVGAGNEPTIFWLTNHVRQVFATDLYLQHDEWDASASTGMLTDPGRYWPGPWEPRRLVVQHMDALDLRYPDDTFDGVFSASSIEHFGDLADVQRSLEEVRRVLRPGGVATISTEYRLAGPPPGLPGILMFDEHELGQLIAASGLELLEPLTLTLSDRTHAGGQAFADSAADVRAHIATHGEIYFHRLDWTRYPQLVLHQDDLRWTSIHLALRKPTAGESPGRNSC